MSKLLFLDVDGVLNHRELFVGKGTPLVLGDDHLLLLEEIVTKTGCKIVLSSTWRLFQASLEHLQEAFDRFEIPMWVSKTPELKTDRHLEIISWCMAPNYPLLTAVGREFATGSKWSLDGNKVSKVVILDDDADANPFGLKTSGFVSAKGFQADGLFVQTTFESGLTRELADVIINFMLSDTIRDVP